GFPLHWEEHTVDSAEGPDLEAIFVDGEVQALRMENKTMLTVRGLLKVQASKGYVTVDMGAVPFVTKGADVMGPGIVEADPHIQVGDLVWVRDIKFKKPLAIGEALITGPEMTAKRPGKAIRSIHFVGDRLWKYDER
ncbi:MAG: PUA domain-containing protein, partial [candidate division NC10 bacterium]